MVSAITSPDRTGGKVYYQSGHFACYLPGGEHWILAHHYKQWKRKAELSATRNVMKRFAGKRLNPIGLFSPQKCIWPPCTYCVKIWMRSPQRADHGREAKNITQNKSSANEANSSSHLANNNIKSPTDHAIRKCAFSPHTQTMQYLKACVPKLCVLLYTVVLSCVAACLVCVIVASCGLSTWFQ